MSAPETQTGARLRVVPVPVKRAQWWCERIHRRLPKVQGAMWALALYRAEVCVGVALVGRPNARVLDTSTLGVRTETSEQTTLFGDVAPSMETDETPTPRLQVLRVAVTPGDASAHGHKGACSMLYGACARAARAMGATDLWTYIHDDERGVSLRAAGWIEDTEHESPGGSYDRPSRRRDAPVEGGAKRRWFAPWSQLLAERKETA